MRALFDVNMLLALADARHVHHARASAWRRTHATHGWASCPLTQNGFIRIACQKSYPAAIPLPDAIALMQRTTARPDHAFWPDDLSLLDQAVIDHRYLLGHRQITDVYLLALAVKHGGRLVTLDSGIATAAAIGASADNLVVV
jgi:uncharacterized protein